MMSMAASAYIPLEAKQNIPHACDYHIMEYALAEHDAGRDTAWTDDVLEQASIQHTNSGRTANNYHQLRLYLAKVEAQKEPGHGYRFNEPIMQAGWAGPGSN